MASAAAAIFPQIANYNPQGFVQGNQLQQQNIGLTAAQAAAEQARVPLIQQQMQGAALQNQLVQQQIADQKAIGAAWAGWDPTSDPSGKSLIQKAISNGATPARVMEVQQHMAQYNANLATADKTTLENHKARNDDFAGKIQAIIDADPKDQDNLIATYQNALLADDPSAQIPAHFSLNEYKALQKVHMYQSDQTKQALEAQQTNEAKAGAQLKEAETQKQQNINALLQQGKDAAQTGGVHPIDAILSPQDDPGLNASLKAMYDRGARFINPNTGISELQEQALKTAAEFKHEISKVNNPTIRAAEVKTAVDKAAAEAPIHTAQAVATERATAPIKLANSIAQAKALREGDNPALAGVPPALAQQTANKALELDNNALTAKKATEDLGHFLDLAERGNKAAGSNLSMLGAESIQALNGIKRINSTEIAGYEGAGNLLDRIKGKIGKLVEGQPVPQDVMDDIRELHQTLGTSAYQQYTSGLDALNKRTGSKYAPIVEAPNIRKSAAPTPAGKGQKLTDTNIARQYLTKAGGDKEKARQLAKQDGWTF